MKGRVLRIAVCLLLCISVLCLSVFADDVPPDDDNNPWLYSEYDQIAFLVWQLLSSWGIDVTYEEVSGYTSPVQDQILDWIYEYLATQPSIESVAAWVVDWVFDTDFWGNLVVNHTLLDDVRQFANWLQSKYPLGDNSSVVINPENQLNNLKVYRLPAYWTNYYDYVAHEWRWEQITVDPDVYVVFYVSELNGREYIYMRPFKQNNTSVTMARYRDGQLNYSDSFQFSRPKIGVWYWDSTGLGYVYDQESGDGIASFAYRLYTSEAVNYAMENSNTVQQVGNMYILTTEVIVPELGVDYTGQDGMTIIDGSPSYEIIEFPDSVSVDNLPAVISTGTLQNPEIDQIYTGIPAFLDAAGDSITFMKQIVFRMPDEVLIALSAVLSAGVIFGFLRIMREH